MFIQRFRLRLREQKIIIPSLPEGLNGMRLVQLTDIHLSPFLSERELAQAVSIANETRAHIALVTGDLISGPGDPLDACIARLAGLKSDLGIYGCLGNHERYVEAEEYAQLKGAEFGLHFLRGQAVKLQVGNAALNMVGVDYQRFNRPYLKDVEALMDPAAFNMLLSHNPDVFPVAARKGFPLTISGHTHGGQVRIEILEQDLNVARFFTPYVDGLYRRGDSSIFVSRGIGTIGLPARLGAPPEVALITLCRT
jgi:predicted MPP superfamily phosphohydrolase